MTNGYKILWTSQAKINFDKIVDYLLKEWSEKTAITFIQKPNKTLTTLQSGFPEIFIKSKKKNLYKSMLHKHVIFTYRIKPRKKVIEIISVVNTKLFIDKK